MVKIIVAPDKAFDSDDDFSRQRVNLLSQIEEGRNYLERMRSELLTKRMPECLTSSVSFTVLTVEDHTR